MLRGAREKRETAIKNNDVRIGERNIGEIVEHTNRVSAIYIQTIDAASVKVPPIRFPKAADCTGTEFGQEWNM